MICEHHRDELRARADHCRRLAASGLPLEVSIELEELADEYELAAMGTEADSIALSEKMPMFQYSRENQDYPKDYYHESKADCEDDRRDECRVIGTHEKSYCRSNGREYR